MVHGYLAAESLLLIAAPSGPLHATSIHLELVESHVTNPNMIHEISKFRSGAGHDFFLRRELRLRRGVLQRDRCQRAGQQHEALLCTLRYVQRRYPSTPHWTVCLVINSRCDGLEHHLPPDDEQLTAADSLHCRM